MAGLAAVSSEHDLAVLPGYGGSAGACAWADLALLRSTNFLHQVKLQGTITVAPDHVDGGVATWLQRFICVC